MRALRERSPALTAVCAYEQATLAHHPCMVRAVLSYTLRPYLATKRARYNCI